MSDRLRMAAIGVGRIGIHHARHIQELSRERGDCDLVAIVDPFEDSARRVARRLQPGQSGEIRPFHRVEDLLEAHLIDAALVSSRTRDHDRDSRLLIDAGVRILLEKPLTDSVETAKALVRHLASGPRKQRSLMQAFMRRFDEPLGYCRTLLDRKAIGTPFKIVSILEDPCPPPVGYSSPGILADMSVHNVDEVIWLFGLKPQSVTAMAANLHNYRVSPVKEDFDDAFMQVTFPGNAIAQVQISRNHVAGYRNETCVYGDEGMIHVGAFQEDPLTVSVEAIGRKGVIDRRSFRMRDYGEPVPVFVERFGPAYSRELSCFVEQCLVDSPFTVTQEDGLVAMQVVEAGVRSLRTGEREVAVEYV